MPTDSVPVELAALRDITDGNPELEQQLFELFLGTCERCLSEATKLIESDPKGLWHDVLHELKGAAANVGAMGMAGLCRNGENLRAEQVSERMFFCKQLRQEYKRVRAYLETNP